MPNRAFTLAEVLITLGIIGVVAAMTMPTLIGNYQKKQTVVQLKKVYTELAQAIEGAKAEYGDIEHWDFNLSRYEFFEQYLHSFIKISESSVRDAKASDIVFYRLNGTLETTFTPLYDGAKIVTLPSGANLFLPVKGSDIDGVNTRGFLVDINGYKRPNKFGRDMFFLRLSKNKGLRGSSMDDGDPDNTERTREQLKNGPSRHSYQCNKRARGMWCAQLIIQDGWEIRKDYPW